MSRPCSYWDRQSFRDADDRLLGEMGDMPPGLMDSLESARSMEDLQDPECGDCIACIESEQVDDGPDWLEL